MKTQETTQTQQGNDAKEKINMRDLYYDKTKRLSKKAEKLSLEQAVNTD